MLLCRYTDEWKLVNACQQHKIRALGNFAMFFRHKSTHTHTHAHTSYGQQGRPITDCLYRIISIKLVSDQQMFASNWPNFIYASLTIYKIATASKAISGLTRMAIKFQYVSPNVRCFSSKRCMRNADYRDETWSFRMFRTFFNWHTSVLCSIIHGNNSFRLFDLANACECTRVLSTQFDTMFNF